MCLKPLSHLSTKRRNCESSRASGQSFSPGRAAFANYRIGEKSSFGVGLNHIVKALTGADTEKVRKFGHQSLSTYNIGGEHTRAECSVPSYIIFSDVPLRQMTRLYPAHLEEAMLAGNVMNINSLLDNQAQHDIGVAFSRVGFGNLVGAVESMGGCYNHGQSRICRAAKQMNR